MDATAPLLPHNGDSARACLLPLERKRHDIPVSQEVFRRRSVVSDVNDHGSPGQLGIESAQGYSWDGAVWRPEFELGTLGFRPIPIVLPSQQY